MSDERDQNSPQNSLNMLPLFDDATMDELRTGDATALESMDGAKTIDKLKTTNVATGNLNVTTPSLEEWKRLYEAAIQFRELAPWNWLFEDQMFAVVNPEDGEVGYCSVMGASGEFLAMAVYPGEEGLLSYERMKRQRASTVDAGRSAPADPDVYLDQKTLMASFEASEDVDKRDRQVFKELGLRFRGRQAWPVLRSYEPGCVRWFLTAKQCRFLTHALEQAMVVVQRVKENPDHLEERPGCILTRTTGNGGHAGEWIDQWPAWPYLEDELDAESVYPYVEVDEMRLKRVMRAGKSSGAWEVDISYAPFSIHEGERPYFPRLMLCVHHGSGLILSAHPAERGAEAAEFVEQFVRAMEQHKMYPEQIVVRRQSVGQLLMLTTHIIGADLLEADFLPGIEMARKACGDLRAR